MIEIGAIVEAKVTRVEPYGIYLAHGNDTILVVLNNVAWLPSPTTLASFRPGQAVHVLVERLNYENGIYSGSLRKLDPEGNPSRQLSREPLGKVFVGKVKMVHQ